MALPDIYSRRKREAGKVDADVFQYDQFSGKLRQQLILLLRRQSDRLNATKLYEALVGTLREELGTERLANEYAVSHEFDAWFRLTPNIDEVLDAMELAARYLLILAKKEYKSEVAHEFVEQANARILEAGVGYQIIDYTLVRVDSQFIHAEVILPALNLLSNKEFANANLEFRQAHAEYVDKNYDDCIHDCCNAFESVLKIILTKKGWAFNANDTASKLIKVAFDNNLIPSYMQTEFAGLRTMLESGIPTVRNKDGGHGTGVNPRNIPEYIAAFQLHQTAAAIVMLIEAAK